MEHWRKAKKKELARLLEIFEKSLLGDWRIEHEEEVDSFILNIEGELLAEFWRDFEEYRKKGDGVVHHLSITYADGSYIEFSHDERIKDMFRRLNQPQYKILNLFKKPISEVQEHSF